LIYSIILYPPVMRERRYRYNLDESASA